MADFDLDGSVDELMPPAERSPYYIVATPFSRFSAGLKAMHLLCHALNRRGQNAFLFFDPRVYPCGDARPVLNPDLQTQYLTQETIDLHFARGRAPIVIYHEGVTGNPLSAKVVVRWALNFPGLLGRDTVYPEEEIRFGYSRELALAVGNPGNVLTMPTSDPRLFYPPPAGSPRSGTCFYAVKYHHIFGGKLFPQTAGSIEITREMSQRELADLLRRSELVWCYENTAVAGEATLCGCPAVYLPNQHLVDKIGRDEMGMDGYAWGDDPAEIARAKATVDRAYPNYLRTFAVFWKQLSSLIRISQERAGQVAYDRKLEIHTGSWEDIVRRDEGVQLRNRMLEDQIDILAQKVESGRRRVAGWV